MPPPVIICLNDHDSVVIARATLLPGTEVAPGVAAVQRIPAGHKVAVKTIAQGQAVRRYGQVIGFATSDIAPGQHVHVHNIGMGDFARDYAYGVDAKPTDYFNAPATFMGIRRPDGRVATRNYIGILTSVNCSAHVADMVSMAFRRDPISGRINPIAGTQGISALLALIGINNRLDPALLIGAGRCDDAGTRTCPDFPSLMGAGVRLNNGVALVGDRFDAGVRFTSAYRTDVQAVSFGGTTRGEYGIVIFSETTPLS